MSDTKNLRRSQWNAIRSLTAAMADGERRLALVAPTGWGKTLVLSAILLRMRPHYTGAVVAAPSLTTEANFYEDLDLSWTGSGPGTTLFQAKKEELYIQPRESDRLNRSFVPSSPKPSE